MKKPLLLTILALLLTTTFLLAQIIEDNQAVEAKIDTYLTQGVSNGFSGAVLIAREGEIVLEKGYGMAHKESEVPYNPATAATIGSVTKQFTATAILKLEEANQLKVTDPISTYFHKLPNDKKDITIHQLLTHSSGLIDVIGEGDFDDIPQRRFFKMVFDT